MKINRKRPSECCHSGVPSKQRRKDLELSANVLNLFSVYMIDELFLYMLRYFISDSGYVDGDSFRSITCVSKHWYAMANSPQLWTVSKDAVDLSMRDSLPRRPSPWIREPRSRYCPHRMTNLIGFANLGLQSKASTRGQTFRARERATGKLYLVEISDASHAKEVLCQLTIAYSIQGSRFLSDLGASDLLYFPVGIDISNGRMMCWFEDADSLETLGYLGSLPSSQPFPVLMDTWKRWLRLALQALERLHCSGSFHGYVCPSNLFLVGGSSGLTTATMKLACTHLTSVTCPKDYRVITQSKDIRSIAVIFLQLLRNRTQRVEDRTVNAMKDCRDVESSPGLIEESRGSASSYQNLLLEDIPELDEEGTDLMVRLLTQTTVLCPSSSHPFLSSVDTTDATGSFTTDCTDSSAYHRIRHLLWLEAQESPVKPERKHIRMDQWAMLVDWIIEIVEVFDLDVRCAFRAMNYFDRFISNSKSHIKSRKFQLISGTCLHTASLLEASCIGRETLAKCADNTFAPTHVKMAQEAILRKLDWKLGCPTTVEFVSAIEEILDATEETRWMIRYVLELALQSQIYLYYQASMIAACVISLSFYTLEHDDIWPVQLEEACGYRWKEMEPCLLRLSAELEHVRSTMPDLKMIIRRYRRSRRGRVSYMHVPRITSVSLLSRRPRRQEEDRS